MIKKFFVLLLAIGFCGHAHAQNKVSVIIDADSPGNRVSPTLHGIFFEEISHAGEGGLYAELIQNRGFEETRLPPGTTLDSGWILPPRTPHFSLPDNGISDWKMEWPVKSEWPAWSMDATTGASISPALTKERPLNPASPNNLRIDVRVSKPGARARVINEGFWGINIVAGENYNCSWYLRTAAGYRGEVKVSLEGAGGNVLAARSVMVDGSTEWRKYHCVLHASQRDTAARFVLSFGRSGRVWLDFVSLMPEHTFKNRPNGLRKDLADFIAGLKPAFIRWPGGCFVEGIDIQSAPDWKRTIGPVEQRPGTYSPWGYWTSDGFGYHEYLQFCEDIGAAALYVFNAGVSCDFRSGTFVPDDSLGGYIQNALDAIEYAIGPVNSKWGKIRAANGHPAVFPLQYVEVGNEQSGPRYSRRYNRFYDAIKKKYPGIRIVASMGIADVNKYTLDSMKNVDIADEHAYKGAGWAMNHYDHFDRHKRQGWDMYVGEYATNAGVGTGNMTAALSDAVYIMAMEKNADLVKMSSYAPLLVNVNDVDWPVNLINFNASASFGRISYYTIQMMSANRADVNLATRVHIDPPAVRTPAFKGGIGLGTWDTQTAYKDIEVIQGGKTVYKSDFLHNRDEWSDVRGEWSVGDSALAQKGMGAQLFSMLKGRSFDTCTIRLKAKRLGGYNAFIIPFAVRDTNTCLRVHIGSWLNSHCVIERVTRGFDVADLTEQKKLDHPIEQGRWYDIRIEVGADTVKCFLEGQLLMSYHEPDKFFALAGKDDKTGEIICKIVNAASTPYQANIRLNGLSGVDGQGQLITLRSEDPDAENSFASPVKYVPVTSALSVAGVAFEHVFPPYSISVLKVKPK